MDSRRGFSEREALKYPSAEDWLLGEIGEFGDGVLFCELIDAGILGRFVLSRQVLACFEADRASKDCGSVYLNGTHRL